MEETIKIKPKKNKAPKQPRLLLSVSSVETFQSCQAKWYYRYVAKLPSPQNYYSTAGSFIHKILEIFLKRLSANVDLYRASTFAFLAAQRDKDLAPLLTPEIVREGKAWLDYLVDFFRSNPTQIPSVLKVEIPFAFKIPDTNITVRGFIDRVDSIDEESLKIIDYKTSSDPSYLKSFQLVTYAFAMKQKFPGKKVQAAYQLIRHDFALKEFTLTEEMESQAINTFVEVGKKIEDLKKESPSTPWKASPSKLCDYCSYRVQCFKDRLKANPWQV